jgi:uncharacterized phage-associated protein
MLKFPAKFIAEYFIHKASQEGKELTHLQVQKLTFLAHGYLLGRTGRPLIEEAVEAWPYGPVIPDLYNLYKKHEAKPVKSIYPPEKNALLQQVFNHIRLDTDVEKAIAEVWEKFKHKSGLYLTELTHQSGTPWDKCYQIWMPAIIPNDLIEEFYSDRFKATSDGV